MVFALLSDRQAVNLCRPPTHIACLRDSHMNIRNQLIILASSIFASTLMVTFAFAQENASDPAWETSAANGELAVVNNFGPQGDGQRIANPMMDEPIVNFPQPSAPVEVAVPESSTPVPVVRYSSIQRNNPPVPVPMVMPEGAPRVHSQFSISGIYQSNLTIGGSVQAGMRSNPNPDNQIYYIAPRN
ncbi:MAG: hypothetical protein AAF456_13210 [Planctomycetota bacterium]